MAKTQVSTEEHKANAWWGNMAGPGITVAAQAVASQVLPTTPVPHMYLCIGNYEFSTGGGAGAEFYGTIAHSTQGEKARQYVNSNAGDYITPTATMALVTASSGTITFYVGETTGPRGGLGTRSTWAVVDLGAA